MISLGRMRVMNKQKKTECHRESVTLCTVIVTGQAGSKCNG